MSRVGEQPVTVPDGVDVTVDGSSVRVKGPNGALEASFDPEMIIRYEAGKVTVARPTDHRRHRSLHGLTRSLIANMVEGVTNGFSKTLELHGTGYRAQLQGGTLVMTVGFSHPVRFEVPEGIKLSVPNPTVVVVEGADKQQVGEVAANIRAVRPPEPYLGKGIRYRGEQIRRKEGKAVTS